MRGSFSSLGNIFSRKAVGSGTGESPTSTATDPSLAAETPPHRFWRRAVMALLPPLSLLLSLAVLVLLLPHHGDNWILPLGLMLLLLIHELGHLLVLRLKGIPARGPYFIPLLGAFVMMSRPSKGEDVALVALAGPFFGGLGALFCLLMAGVVGAQNCDHWTFAQGLEALVPHYCYAAGVGPQWLALAHIGFLFNLINLVPLLPFDGGQAIGIASRWFWLLGVPVGILFLRTSLQLTTPIGIVLSVVVLGTLLISLGTTCYAVWKPSFGGAMPRTSHPLSLMRRGLILLLYLLLSAGLFLGDNFVVTLLKILQQGIAFPLNL